MKIIIGRRSGKPDYGIVLHKTSKPIAINQDVVYVQSLIESFVPWDTLAWTLPRFGNPGDITIINGLSFSADYNTLFRVKFRYIDYFDKEVKEFSAFFYQRLEFYPIVGFPVTNEYSQPMSITITNYASGINPKLEYIISYVNMKAKL